MTVGAVPFSVLSQAPQIREGRKSFSAGAAPASADHETAARVVGAWAADSSAGRC